jgi:hypothetical protein
MYKHPTEVSCSPDFTKVTLYPLQFEVSEGTGLCCAIFSINLHSLILYYRFVIVSG